MLYQYARHFAKVTLQVLNLEVFCIDELILQNLSALYDEKQREERETNSCLI